MSTVLEVKYINGRVHGTPWGTSHNEGAVEFPPSPWRILRSLVSTWFERSSHVPETTVRSLIDILSRVSPVYTLPKFSKAHVRHYLPESAHLEGVSTSTAKVLDAFASVNNDEALYVTWPIELSITEREAFSILADQLPYLGRAESVVQARLLPEGEEPKTSADSRTISTTGTSQTNARPIRMLSPTAETNWDSLMLVPWMLRQQGFVLPPGSKQVNYFADQALEWEPGRASASQRQKVNLIEWSIQGRGKVPLTAALLYCELIRQDVLRVCKNNNVDLDWRITGKENGRKSERHHEHIYFLPVASGPFLTGIRAWLPPGQDGSASIDEATARFLTTLNELEFAPKRTLGTSLPDSPDSEGTESGSNARNRKWLADFREVGLFLQHCGPVDPTAFPVFSKSALWETLTPYAPPRHLRSDGRFARSLQASVRKDLAEIGLPDPFAIEIQKVSAQGLHALDFRRHRSTKNERLRDSRPAFHLRLRFSEPVTGPISIGAHSHFGLGHFVPATPNANASVNSSQG